MIKTNFLTLLTNCVLFLIATPLFSQVDGTGLGTLKPHPSAALDVVNTTAGILIPRMDVTQKNAIIAPATGLLVYDKTNKCISQNTGTPEAPTWVCLVQKDTQNSFFYMPSIAVDASKIHSDGRLDLYGAYKQQFSKPAAKSDGAPGAIPYFPKATDLYYYILQYDKTVFDVFGISSIGTIDYRIIKESDYNTFINVLFVLK